MIQEEVAEEGEGADITHIPIQSRDRVPVRVQGEAEEEVDRRGTTLPSPNLLQTVLPTLVICTPISHYPNDQI